MTEYEASNKRCCGPEGCGDPGNPNHDGSITRWCIGSRCMGWRWAEAYQIDQQGRAYSIDLKSDDRTGPLKFVHPGFCGLASKP